MCNQFVGPHDGVTTSTDVAAFGNFSLIFGSGQLGTERREKGRPIAAKGFNRVVHGLTVLQFFGIGIRQREIRKRQNGWHCGRGY